MTNAWIDIQTETEERDAGLCDRDQAIALFHAFDKMDRTSCVTTEELDGEQQFSFNIYFAPKKPNDTRDAKVYMEIMAMRPSGHDLWLQVPRYALGLPLPSRKHFDAATPPVSTQEVIATIDAIYNTPACELRAWAEAQSFLKKR